MNKAWIAVSLAVLALAGCEKDTGPDDAAGLAVPPTAAPASARAVPLASFEAMDVDADGRVSSVEHAKASQGMFQAMDADSDGALTVAEMDAARDIIGGTGSLSSEKKIAALDGDGDGRLTLAEYVGGSNALFARVDANDDNGIDRAEWDKGHGLLNPSATPTPTPTLGAAALTRERGRLRSVSLREVG